MKEEKTNVKRFKKLKKDIKGITLIALVVTIIVLLILAGIALNLTIGENGLFTRAQNAANTWQLAEQNEQDAMQEFSDMIDEILNGPKPKEGTLAAMYVQALEDGCPGGEECTDTENHLHIGDYVNFKSKVNEYINEDEDQTISIEVLQKDTGVNETQTYTVNSNTNQLNWQVLGYNAEKMQVKLIASTPLKSNGSDGYLWMTGAESYAYGIDRLNTICSDIYGEIEEVAEARSVKIEDINGLLGVEESEIEDIDINFLLGCREYGASISDIVGWTPESYLKEEAQATLTGTVTGYWYTVNGTPEGTNKYVSTDNETYNLIFNNARYWLSSPGVLADSDDAYFGPGFVGTDVGLSVVGCGYYTFNSYGYENDFNAYGHGVRPVVFLKSNVQASDVQKIADQVNPSWEGSDVE